MADQDQKFSDKTNQGYGTDIGEVKQYGAYGAGDFTEETSTEIAAPVTTYNQSSTETENKSRADQKFDGKTNHRYGTDIGEVKPYGGERGYKEETAAEIAAPVTTYNRSRTETDNKAKAGEGKGVGYTALILSILSLFIWPVLMGAAGIVLGFVASRRGSKTLGGWAIGIGAVSIIIGLFILPFF